MTNNSDPLPDDIVWTDTPNSSNVLRVGYSPATLTLLVQFRSGTYAYHDVSQETYDALLAAPSTGSFINTHLRRNKS